MTTLDDVYGAVARWQSETFKDATLKGAVAHLKKEALEVVEASRADVPSGNLDEELADVFFMLVHACELRGTDLAHQVMRKLDINKRRDWPAQPNSSGCYHHQIIITDLIASQVFTGGAE